jgi:hypothetical protein
VNTLLKSLIVWLMLVAIPFQGFASASMITCAPMQPAAPAAMTHEHCATMAAMHHGAPHHAMASDAAPDHSSSHHHTGAKCSTCASCCVGAAMAPSAPVARVPADAPDIADFQFDAGHVATVDLALPERPPKASLT